MVNFIKWLENSGGNNKVFIAEVTADSYGTHSNNYKDEKPAENPSKHAHWTYHLENPKSWELLVGKTIEVQDKSGGSFHERWLRVYIFAIVDEQNYNELVDLEPNLVTNYDPMIYKKPKIHNFIFRTPKSFVDSVADTFDRTNGNKFASSDEYWANLIQRNTAGIPPKRAWDGD